MSSQPYNAESLDANKNGQLASSQISSFIPMILMGGIFFLIGLFLAAAGVSAIYVFVTKSQPGALFGVVMFGIPSLLVFWAVYRIAGTRIIDILIGQVRSVEGPGGKSGHTTSGYSTTTGRSTGGTTYLYVVGEMQFQISRKMYKFLPEWNKKVRAYYTPLSKSLVNIEFL